jgi:hypothetical protein
MGSTRIALSLLRSALDRSKGRLYVLVANPQKNSSCRILFEQNTGKVATACLSLRTVRKMCFLEYFLWRFSPWKSCVSTLPGFQENKIFTARWLSSRLGGTYFGTQVLSYQITRRRIPENC